MRSTRSPIVSNPLSSTQALKAFIPNPAWRMRCLTGPEMNSSVPSTAPPSTRP